MATFVWRPADKFGGRKWRENNPCSNGREERSPGLLLLMIIYHFKKQTVDKLTLQIRNIHDLHRVL
jgi:hypothetical protein